MIGIKKRPYCKGFTLYELIIAMVLFAIVAGLVLSFIAFIGNFNKNNDYEIDKMTQTVTLREEIDFWFSCFDSDDYIIEISGLQQDILAQATSKSGEVYYIKSQSIATGEDESALVNHIVFTYPQSDYHGEVVGQTSQVAIESFCIKAVYFSKSPDNLQINVENKNKHLKFTISCPVSKDLYACDLIYV